MPRIRRLNARFKNRSNRVTQKDIRKQDSSPRCCRLSPILWFVSATIIIISGSIFGYVRWNAQPTSALSKKKAKSDKLDTSSLQNCTISFVPPPPRQEPEWRKPLWIPSFPSSGSASPSNKGDLVKDLIEKLFGKQGAVKNYHVSMKNRLRRCKGLSETVGCSQGHPYVPVQPEQHVSAYIDLEKQNEEHEFSNDTLVLITTDSKLSKQRDFCAEEFHDCLSRRTHGQGNCVPWEHRTRCAW